LVYYNGGGGATLEFFSYDDNGSKIPINDTNNPASIKAYYNIITTPVLQFTSISASGGNVTINWTGSNWRLQEASALMGNPGDWGDVSPQPGGNTITVPAGSQKFYRLVSP
jgi:hypothetical protein